MLAISTSVVAQGTNTRITGTIRDDAGELLTGATVTIKNEATGFITGASTGLAGTWDLRIARKCMVPGQNRTGVELALDVFNVANSIDSICSSH